MSTTIAVLWWIALAVAALLVAPTAYYLLNRVFRAAQDVAAYSAAILQAAETTAANLSAAAVLDETPDVAELARAAARHLAAETRDRGGAGPGRS